MASPPAPRKRLAGTPTPGVECDDILRQIFIRLDSHTDLARACVASPAFRRVITDPHFLRRFHCLHPPPLLGILSYVFHPAEPPHRSASAARKLLDDGIDFSCKSFLPSPGPWHLLDSRNGRVLHSGVAQHMKSCCEIHRYMGMPLAVCDPLHRRYVMLPSIPEELATLVDHGAYITAFLAPPAEEKDGSASPLFRVMCVACSTAKLVLFVFSSSGVGGKQWHGINIHDWSSLREDNDHPFLGFQRHSFAHERLYWPIYYRRKRRLLVVDVRGSRPVFSTMDFPTHTGMSSVAFVEAAGEQERLAAVTVDKHKGEHAYHLQYAVLRGDNGDHWESEAIIYLPLRYSFYRFIGVARGYLLLEATLEGRKVSRPDIACFSLDFRTLQIERFCGSEHSLSICISPTFYAGCPSYLSPPTV